MFFEDSRSDRKRKAMRRNGTRPQLKTLVPPVRQFELMSFDELHNGKDRTFIFDTEDYPNYWLAAFKCLETSKVLCFERVESGYLFNGIELDYFHWQMALSFVFHRFCIIGFNSNDYDIPMVTLALKGVSLDILFQISQEIIQGGLRQWEIEKRFQCRAPKINHIDLIEVAPLEASLKLYAGRLHCKRMQDLPFSFSERLEPEQIAVVRGYCVNDLDNTQLLYMELKPHIELRLKLGNEYKADLRSKSDAQLAQIIVNTELERVTGNKPAKAEDWSGRSFRYQAPAYIQFSSNNLNEALQDILHADIFVMPNGHVSCPAAIEGKTVTIGGNRYKIGMGGLHSQEKSVSYAASDELLIIDRDVIGYYPNLILKNGFYPKHIGPAFLDALQNIVDRRYRAKKDGIAVTADSLKIASNGIFGKLSDPWSTVYDPSMMVQTTLTGQLSLLMLIEQLTLAGFKVISANTDGVVTLCPQADYAAFEAVIKEWERVTALETEETRYRSLHCRDVNNYIAVKEDGKCKTKGVYCERGSALNSVLSKNPETLILSDAVQAYVASGVPIAETIEASRDFRRFVAVRNVKGGAHKDGTYLGKSVRWYYAADQRGTLNYVLTGNNVPKTEGAKPCMDLPDEFPDDVDTARYIEMANEMLYDIGILKKTTQPAFF